MFSHFNVWVTANKGQYQAFSKDSCLCLIAHFPLRCFLESFQFDDDMLREGKINNRRYRVF